MEKQVPYVILQLPMSNLSFWHSLLLLRNPDEMNQPRLQDGTPRPGGGLAQNREENLQTEVFNFLEKLEEVKKMARDQADMVLEYLESFESRLKSDHSVHLQDKGCLVFASGALWQRPHMP